MEKAEKQLLKLLERKQDYLNTVQKKFIQDAIRAEINIIKEYITTSKNEIEEIKTLIRENQKETEVKNESIKKLLLVCKLYGINLSEWLLLSNKTIEAEIKRDQKDNAKRIPTNLIKLFYDKDKTESR